MRAAVPHGHYKTVTLVAGLRLSGLAAAKAFDGPINAALFEDWVEKCLVPTLSPGDIVVMDNLSSHKGPRVEQLIKTVGAELRYLPPYSPDMNPIEKAYSKLKAQPNFHARRVDLLEGQGAGHAQRWSLQEDDHRGVSTQTAGGALEICDRWRCHRRSRDEGCLTCKH